MKIKKGPGRSEYGAGISVCLSGEEVARAISAYLVARDVNISGPRTIWVNGASCEAGEVYVDPSGFVVRKGKKIDGRTGELAQR